MTPRVVILKGVTGVRQLVARGNYGPALPPVIAAQELGPFKKAGADAQFSGSSASMEGVTAGEIDVVNQYDLGAFRCR